MKAINKFVIYFLFVAAAVSFYSSTAEAAYKIPKESTIGGIEIDGLTYNEAREKLQEEVDLWINKDPLTNFDETISIPRESFEFDIDQVIQEVTEQTRQPWYLFFAKSESINLPLTVKVNAEKIDTGDWPQYINIEETLRKAEDEAAYLAEMFIETVYKDDEALEKETIAAATFSIPDTFLVEVEEMTEQLNGKTIPPKEQFSMIESILREVQPSISKESINFFASALYALSLRTDLDIIERHSQQMIPSYTEAGIEAAVNTSTKQDLVLYNPNHFAYTITASINDGELQLTMNSILIDKQIDYYVETTNEVQPRTLYRYSYDLPSGFEVPMESGQKGAQVEVYRVESIDGKDNKTLISRDFYPPKPTVLLVSTKESPEESDGLETEVSEHFNRLLDEIYANVRDSADHDKTAIYESVLEVVVMKELLNMTDQSPCREQQADNESCQEWNAFIKDILEQEINPQEGKSKPNPNNEKEADVGV